MPHEGMVHALQEIWRVLKPGTTFVDLRPLVESHRLLTDNGAEARLRIPFKMVVARYRKL